ncbi:hypothetical protein [Stakelama marina]|uniref:hypothetical protein n=1 Tax=Stakelama marina TaxID=2826939 RepID=UPI0024C30D40|nr:hypothetical protein [Stakelama marina]
MTHGRNPIPPEPAVEDESFDADFEPVPTRQRHDGWTPDKQREFIEALAASGCVDSACRAVGMSTAAAYNLRARTDAQSFRCAWENALEYAVSRLSDAALSRAIHGVVRPVFYQGEQIGERRYYDERLAMFLLRYRDPVRYGAWRDSVAAERHPDQPALGLARSLNALGDHAWASWFGHARPDTPLIFPTVRFVRPDEERAEAEARARDRREKGY